MVKRTTSRTAQRVIWPGFRRRLIARSTLRENVVNEAEEEEEEEEGHGFHVGGFVRILRDKKKERVNKIATVVEICPKSVWVKIEPDNTLFLKRVTTIEKNDSDASSAQDSSYDWPVAQCQNCDNYGARGNSYETCEDSGYIYDSDG
eukprot:scaffold37531_cov69-Attheya_sp.AAC.2